MASTPSKRMVTEQLHPRGIKDPAVLRAMEEVSRDAFVPSTFRDLAWADTALPISHGQTISQPYVVALMTEALAPAAGDRILEIGTGSGYQAAVLAHIGVEVFTVERLPALAHRARRTLAAEGYEVHLRCDDGTIGWPEEAPFDGILVTASGPTIPNPLLEQLSIGGRLVFPLATDHGQTLVLITRKEDGLFRRHELAQVAFVPLIGREGYPEEATGSSSTPSP